MPLVTVKLLKGRSAEQKRRLTEELVKAFERALGTAPEHVSTIMEDVDAEDWFVATQSLADIRRRRGC